MRGKSGFVVTKVAVMNDDGSLRIMQCDIDMRLIRLIREVYLCAGPDSVKSTIDDAEHAYESVFLFLEKTVIAGKMTQADRDYFFFLKSEFYRLAWIATFTKVPSGMSKEFCQKAG